MDIDISLLCLLTFLPSLYVVDFQKDVVYTHTHPPAHYSDKKKEWNNSICSSMNGSRDNCAKGGKTVTFKCQEHLNT